MLDLAPELGFTKIALGLEIVCALGSFIFIDVYSALSSTLVGVLEPTTARAIAVLHPAIVCRQYVDFRQIS